MNYIDFLQVHETLFAILTTLLGLTVGSFLNVLIYRLPLIMEAEWQQEYANYFKLSKNTVSFDQLRLWYPPSHCPRCKMNLRIRDNIPLISYLFLKGKCAACNAPISLQYPLTESICGLLSLMVALHFGCSWQAVMALLFTWLLIGMSGIDIKHQILPDILTYIGIWLGLFLSTQHIFIDSSSAIFGGLIGYLSLWLIANVFKQITHKEGMGYGDFKLFAMLGVWCGWQMLLLIILIASFLGAIVGIGAIFLQKKSRNTPIPFGPFLAFGGWIALLWGKPLLELYLKVLF